MFKILSGVPKIHRRHAAILHFDAFAGKIGRILGRDGRGENFFAEVIDPEFGIWLFQATKANSSVLQDSRLSKEV